MSDLTPEAKKFLEQHQGTGAPTLQQKSRARAAVLTALAAPTAAAAVASGIGVGAKVLIAVVAVSVGGAVAVPVVKWARSARQPVAIAQPTKPADAPARWVPQAVEVEAVAPPPSAALPPAKSHRVLPVVEAIPTPVDAREAQPTPPIPAPAHSSWGAPGASAGSVAIPTPNDAQLSAELELLTAAQSALRASQPQEALRQLDAHQRRFGPSARLTEEVAAARIGALCALGRKEEARAVHARLPEGSVFFSRLGHACW
jgi:hypothetical protein